MFMRINAKESFGGARYMIEDGVLDGRKGPKVDEIYGAHLWNHLPAPSVAARMGAPRTPACLPACPSTVH
jgi:metal-dependent amidase/aminoacylase/carboxypeptidase family protein